MGKEIIIRDLTFSYGGNGNQLEHISLDIVRHCRRRGHCYDRPIRKWEKLFNKSN